MAPQVNPLAGAVSSAIAARRASADLANVQADTVKKGAETATIDNQGALLVQQHQIAKQTLASAKAAAAGAKVEEQFFKTRYGKVIKWIDLTFRGINPFATTAKNLNLSK